MREVDQSTFLTAHRAGAVVIDVREPAEYVTGHVPGARLIPLGQLPDHVTALPRAAPVYVICASGNSTSGPPTTPTWARPTPPAPPHPT